LLSLYWLGSNRPHLHLLPLWVDWPEICRLPLSLTPLPNLLLLLLLHPPPTWTQLAPTLLHLVTEVCLLLLLLLLHDPLGSACLMSLLPLVLAAAVPAVWLPQLQQ
jgi:hypothetical protein